MARIVIVVPTYNRARSVGQAIDSVLEQGRDDLACIVVDDASTDATPDVLARYAGDPRVSVVRCPSNRGVTGAKNVGLDHLPADCEYFGILDSDDVLLPGAIAALVRGFESGPIYSQVFGWCVDPITDERTGRMLEGHVLTYEGAICGKMQGEFWQLARTRFLEGRRFEPRAAGGESSLWWPLLKKAPGLLVPDVVRHYDRTGSDRVSRVRFDRRAAERHMWIYRAKRQAFGDDLKAACPRAYADVCLEEAKWAALAGLRGDAVAAWWRAVRAGPTLRAGPIAVMTTVPRPLLRSLYELRYAAR